MIIVAQHNDAFLQLENIIGAHVENGERPRIVIVYPPGKAAVVAGYPTLREAEEAMAGIIDAFKAGEKVYKLPSCERRITLE